LQLILFNENNCEGINSLHQIKKQIKLFANLDIEYASSKNITATSECLYLKSFPSLLLHTLRRKGSVFTVSLKGSVRRFISRTFEWRCPIILWI